MNVIIVPDLDKGGMDGADATAKVLHGVAKSVRIARLPGEVVESKGKDVRDILREQGENAVRKAIKDAKAGQADGKPELPRFTQLLTSTDLLRLDVKLHYLVNGIMVAKQPMILGGRSKTLKTCIAVDLALSLGSGTPFLNHFLAEEIAVGFWSGESGAATIRETALRIAKAKRIKLRNCNVYWSFDIPKLSRLDHLDHLAATIDRHKLGVVVVDPLYLSLMTGDTAGGASNIYAMGATLEPLSKLAQDNGATLVLLHHFRKTGQSNDSEPAGLDELAQSGAAEWARQWILLQRRAPYQADGNHELWMRCGGSAGHASLWALDIYEGILDPDALEGRRWCVELKGVADARAEAKQHREKQKAAEMERTEQKHRELVMDALGKFPEGETARALRPLTHLNQGNVDRALAGLEERGQIELCDVEKRGTKHPGYRRKRMSVQRVQLIE